MDCVFGGIYINDISTVWEVYMSLPKIQILATQSFYVHTFLWWLNDNSPLVYCVHVDNIVFCLGFIYYYSTNTWD